MHIPIGDTNTLTILSFEDALADRSGSKDGWLYLPSHYDEYRYVLGTVGQRPLVCVGINPSTAEPGNLDNTCKSVERIARGNGFDSFLMFNVYAQRATSPDDMDKTVNAALHRENMKAFAYLLTLASACGERPAVWAAWGTIIEKRQYLADCLGEMIGIGEEHGARWCRAGSCSKKGHPHHPLYLPKDAALEPFDAAAYLKGIRQNGR